MAAVIPYAVQWMNPFLASGSSTTSTSSTASPDGASRHVIVGAVPAPSQVSSFGIAPPSLMSGEASLIVSGRGRELGFVALPLLVAAAAREGGGGGDGRYERAAGAHCCSARSPVPSRAAGVGTAGLSRRYHSASSAD